MHEIIIDEALFDSAEEVHAHLALELGFPAHYGGNLDALNDCLGDVGEPVFFTVLLSHDAGETGFSAWVPKLVRSLLRAARDNESIEVVVHATSLGALARLAACPGLPALLEDEMFTTQGLVACIKGR